MVPNGQAIVQTLQPTHVASSTILAPVTGSSLIASTGQADMHHASAHWVQVYGTLRPSCSKANTFMRDLAGLNVPVFSYEHAISHCRQPVHFTGSRYRDFIMCRLLVGDDSCRSVRPGAVV